MPISMKKSGVRQWKVSGDPTEGALVVAAEKAGLKLEELKKQNPRIAHLAFERIRKRMTTIHEIPTSPPFDKGGQGGLEGSVIAYVKGAPKETLTLCTKIKKAGKVIEFTEKERDEILKQNDVMASEGLRVLAVAYKERGWGLETGGWENRKKHTAEEVEKDLTFIGLAAMFDPPRPEVKKAIEECHTAGIRVIVMTGDYGLTAQAIAKEVGIGGSNPKVITGIELSKLSHRELKELLKK